LNKLRNKKQRLDNVNCSADGGTQNATKHQQQSAIRIHHRNLNDSK